MLVFQIRTFLDALDGIVARERRGITKHVSQVGTAGYIIDGTCDSIGFFVFVIGIWLYLRKSVPRQCKYVLIEQQSKESAPSQKHIAFVTACFLGQLALSASCWNFYLDK